MQHRVLNSRFHAQQILLLSLALHRLSDLSDYAEKWVWPLSALPPLALVLVLLRLVLSKLALLNKLCVLFLAHLDNLRMFLSFVLPRLVPLKLSLLNVLCVLFFARPDSLLMFLSFGLFCHLLPLLRALPFQQSPGLIDLGAELLLFLSNGPRFVCHAFMGLATSMQFLGLMPKFLQLLMLPFQL